MSFTIAQLAQLFSVPSDVILFLFCLGVVLGWFARTRIAGIAICTILVFICLLFQFSPLSGWMTAGLEDRFSGVRLPSRIDGLIVLGGAVAPSTTLVHQVPSLNAEAERMTEFVRLAKLYPKARLVFAGGAGSLDPAPTMSEADVAKMFFQQQGLAVNRIAFESRSQNTYENVLFAKSLVHPRPGESWVLVSSAQDVPRCIGVFRKLRWPVIPRSVAYKSDESDSGSFSDNLKAVDRSSHEWIGLLFYRAMGRTDELFPRPDK